MQKPQTTPVGNASDATAGFRILRVLPTLGTGGTEKQCLEIMAEVERLQQLDQTLVGLRIDLATIYKPQSEQQLPLRCSAQYHALNENRTTLGVLKAARKLARILQDYDVVHAMLWPAVYAVALARPAIPFIASLHGSALVAGPLGIKLLLDRLAFRRAQRVVFNSQAGAGALVKYLGLDPVNTAVVENGKTLYRGPAVPRSGIVCLARAQMPKRQSLLLDAIQLIPEQQRPVTSFIGQQTADAAMRKEVESRQLTSAVDLVGEVADALPHLAAAVILALPTDHEGLPNSILEAWSAGAAVIASNVPGVRELVRDGEDGLLVENSALAWSEAIMHLLSDPQLQVRLTMNGKQRIEQQFSLRAAACAWGDLYRKVHYQLASS